MPNEKSLEFQYKKYENLYEMDVMYSLQEDLKNEMDDYKKRQLSSQMDYQDRYKK